MNPAPPGAASTPRGQYARRHFFRWLGHRTPFDDVTLFALRRDP